MNYKLPISIIVAAYNEERYIKKFINSVMNQSYANWELIIIDDNSKDKTFDIVTDFSKKNKKVKVYMQNPKLRGPGNAWNFAVKKSKGEILFFGGADTILGRDYIKKMIEPIIKGIAVGTIHKKEKLANKNNLWARAFGVRECVDKNNEGVIFGAILKSSYDKVGGFDPDLGYADDKTLSQKLKIKSFGVEAEIYHYNPDTFSDIWRHHKWVGASYDKPLLLIVSLPIFPFWVLYKSIKQLKEDFFLPFLIFLPIYNTLRYLGYFTGAFKKLIFRKIYLS